MGRWVWIAVGLLVAVMGAVFTLQGVGTIKGSAMTGTTLWTVLGPVIVVIGIAVAALGWWRGGRRRP